MAQKVQYNKHLNTFAAHFTQNVDKKKTPKQFHDIMKFEMVSTVNLIRYMKTYIDSSYTLCMKEILESNSN